MALDRCRDGERETKGGREEGKTRERGARQRMRDIAEGGRKYSER